MSEIVLPKNANSDSAYVVDGNDRNRALMTAELTDTFTPSKHPNGLYGYYTDTDGKKHRAMQVAVIFGGNASQAETMPEASASNLGKVIQYVGDTSASYTNGYFYKSVALGTTPETYAWSRINVQPAGTGAAVQWGDITGTLSTQSDLNTALSNKQNKLTAGTNIAIDSSTNTISATDTTYTAGSGLTLTGTAFSADVQSVNTQTGAVVLDGEDINALVGGTTDTVQNHMQSLRTDLGDLGDDVDALDVKVDGLIPAQTGQSGKFLTTNGTSTSWATVSGSSVWGGITGTLSSQTDLQTALDSKVTQYSTMPTASASNLGEIAQFVGATTTDYTNGYFYKCSQLTGNSTALTTSGTSGLGTVSCNTATFADQVSNWADTYNFEFVGYPETIIVRIDPNTTETKVLTRDSAQDANGLYAWSTSGGNTYWTDTLVPEANTYFLDASQGGSVEFYAEEVAISTSYTGLNGRWQRDEGSNFFSDVTLSDYGISYNGVALVGAKIQVVYSNSGSNATYGWSAINVQAGGSGAVDSVNGLTGTVVLTGANINATVSGATDTITNQLERHETQIQGKATASSILGATKCKVTYSAEGVITAGADLSESDIPSLSISKVTNLQSELDAKASISVNTTATLTSAGWSSSSQTVTVSGITASGVVIVSPAPSSASGYASAGIICTAQSANSLTFTCDTTPTSDITVNVVQL